MHKPRYVEDWQQWHRFWSNRMMLLAAIIQFFALVADVSGDLVGDWRLRLAIGAAGIVCTLGGIYARMLYQGNLLRGSKAKAKH